MEDVFWEYLLDANWSTKTIQVQRLKYSIPSRNKNIIGNKFTFNLLNIFQKRHQNQSIAIDGEIPIMFSSVCVFITSKPQKGEGTPIIYKLYVRLMEGNPHPQNSLISYSTAILGSWNLWWCGQWMALLTNRQICWHRLFLHDFLSTHDPVLFLAETLFPSNFMWMSSMG